MITGIAYSSYSTVSTVSADKNVPTFEIAGSLTDTTIFRHLPLISTILSVGHQITLTAHMD